MTPIRQIRASFDRDAIKVYQAYSPAIADAALAAQKFVAPFSFHRMTWIKPSFLWLMHRSNWGSKANQQRTLAVRISRDGWEHALSCAVLTSYERTVHRSAAQWRNAFEAARVHVQWGTERSLRGSGLNYLSIQVGISRHMIRQFVDEWICEIRDITGTVTKTRRLLRSGNVRAAKRLLPIERVYPQDSKLSNSIFAE